MKITARKYYLHNIGINVCYIFFSKREKKINLKFVSNVQIDQI